MLNLIKLGAENDANLTKLGAKTNIRHRNFHATSTTGGFYSQKKVVWEKNIRKRSNFAV